MSTNSTESATTAAVPELAQIAENWRHEAEVLAKRGDRRTAGILTACADEVLAAAPEFTRFLSEAEATQRSGRTGNQVRRLALAYLGTPHVRMIRRGGRVMYELRACIVPRRMHLEMVRGAGARRA
jgi:hypothetical protein